MMNIRRYKDLGKADHGWLHANFHFSFSEYFDRKYMNFGALRVINDDIIDPHSGFSTHPHNNMEIITYVRKGAISHEDSAGNKGITAAGDVQVMSAGSGIQHSEFNRSEEASNLYQIWIMPNKTDVKPRWDQAEFPRDYVKGQLSLLVSGRDEDEGKGALFIHQDAAIYGGRIKAGNSITQEIKYGAYILVSDGEIEINGENLSKGDGATISDEDTVTVLAKSGAEILIIDVPPHRFS